MAIKLNERTLALLAARSVPNQLTYLAMTVKLNERTLALLVARSSSKYSVYILTLKTAFSARICAEYLNRRRQMLFLLSFIAIANLVYQFYSHYKFCYINLYDVGGAKAPNIDAYGLFRAMHFHNPTQYSHIVGIIPLFAHIVTLTSFAL